LFSVHVFHVLFPKDKYSTEIPEFPRVFVEVLTGIVAYDFLFFWIHLAMHKYPPLNMIHMHLVHHDQRMLCASEVQHHSAVDAFLQVATNIIVQNMHTTWYGKKHTLSRLLHNVVITYMLTEIHAGYDGFWSLHNIFPKIYGGAKRHEEHHKYGCIFYQQFFMYLDNILIWYQSTSQQP
jgi:sterol desaturase/sphingolipid hydroxylase (fatty acid hydroxylase superfamily)